MCYIVVGLRRSCMEPCIGRKPSHHIFDILDHRREERTNSLLIRAQKHSRVKVDTTLQTVVTTNNCVGL